MIVSTKQIYSCYPPPSYFQVIIFIIPPMFVLLGLHALRFRGNNVNEYGIFVGPSQSLTSFSVCFWIKATEDSDNSILSYAYRFGGTYVSNGLLFYLMPYLTILFYPFGDGSDNDIMYVQIYFIF
jgi:hypothetical protein